MGATLSLKTHEYKKSRNGSSIARINPYVRLKASTKNEDGEWEDHAPVFIQNGLYFSEGGEEITAKDLPKWIAAEVAKLSETVKREVGLIK
jgi:hypothetical protein